VDKAREKLFDLTHGGIGMIDKENVLTELDVLLREDEGSSPDDDLALIRIMFDRDSRQCFTFKEVLSLINDVEGGRVDYGDAP
jgi:hypothetical protein